MHPEYAIPWYRSIRFRLVVVAIIVEAVMLTLLVANSYRLVSDALESQTRAHLESLAPLFDASLAGRVFQRDHSEISAIIRQLVATKSSEIRYIVVLDRRDEVMASAGELTPRLLSKDPPEDRDVAAAGQTNLTYDASVPLMLYGHRVGSVRFGLSLAGMASLRANVLHQSLLIALGEIFLSLLLLATGGYLITRHVASLVAATRRITNADYSTPIIIPSQDEIGVLADNFNAMATTVRNRIDQLAESETRFRTIFDAAGDAFFIHDSATGQLLDVNKRMCEMYGCTHEQALKSSIADFSANVEPYTSARALEKLRLAREQGPQKFDWLAQRLNGDHFWVEVDLRRANIGAADRIIALVRDISERKRHQHELEFLAHHDMLTQLPNRVLLTDRLQLAVAQAQRSNRLFAIAYLDLDGFKQVNDSFGHETGDQLLIWVGRRLKEQVRAGDTVCRLGGDEFVLVLGDLTSGDECELTIQRVLDVIAMPYHINGQTIHISTSIGITVYPVDDADIDTLLRHADQAMYMAKQTSPNRFHMFNSDQDRLARAHHNARTRIEEALPQNEFVLYYQPKVDMRSGTVIGAEALIRWQHPDDGLVPPANFLPIVEDSHFAIPLGEWVIGTAMAQLSSWHAAGLTLAISVNISARHLQSPTFTDRLAAILARYPDVPPGRLELEIVESVALQDIVSVSQVIDGCHKLGVTFALDDFGTGYSSLSYFRRLKVDVLKIDQSFVRDLLTNAEDHAIVASMINLTHLFKRQVIAEGVETAELGAALLALGCRQAQGYGIARPMSAAALDEWITTWRPDPLWVTQI